MIYQTIKILVVLAMSISLIGCHRKEQEPQKVRHLHTPQKVDTIAMAKLQFNRQMTEAADQACNAFVEKDLYKYTKHIDGFWYTKTITKNSKPVQKGQELLLNLQINELNGETILETKDFHHVVGNGDLPRAITRSLHTMNIGEEMRIIAPWYTAYGVNGTNIVQPYSNLLITLTIQE